MSKLIIFDKQAQDKLLNGVKILSKTVGSTLGPGGKSVIFENFGWPLATKDGVTVAKQISLKDKFENIGCQMVKQVAAKTCDDVGDGTTTSSVLAESFLSSGISETAKGVNPFELKQDLEILTKDCIDYIRNNIRIDISDNLDVVKEIATVSANWDKNLGEIVSKAVLTVGVDGTILIEDARSYETTIHFVDGIQFERSCFTPYLLSDTKRQMTDFNNPFVLLYAGKIEDPHQFEPILVAVSRYRDEKHGNRKRPLVIVADDFSQNFIQTLIVNNHNVLDVTCIKAPHYADMRIETMEDLGIFLNCEVYNPVLSTKDVENLTLNDLGSCDRFTNTIGRATFIGGHGNGVKERIEELKIQREDKNITVEIKARLDKRIAQLAASVAYISIGANSEVEYQEKRDRIDDAVSSTRAAISDGIVAGGCYSYIRYLGSKQFKNVCKKLSPNSVAPFIFISALESPFIKIAENTGKSKDVMNLIYEIMKSKKPYWGYDFKQMKFCNLVDAGVVDPFKVTKAVLENSVSVASLMLTSSALIVEEDEPKTNTNNNNIPNLF